MENQPQPQPQSEVINELDNFFNLSFDADAQRQLRQIALWAKICSLSAFAGYIISIVVAIFGHKDYSLEAEGFSFGGVIRSGNSGSPIAILITVVIGGIINYILYRFAIAVDQGVQSSDALKVNTGFNTLHIYFKILGIGMMIAFGLIILVFVIAFFTGLTSSGSY
jgi:hypothetical protein